MCLMVSKNQIYLLRFSRLNEPRFFVGNFFVRREVEHDAFGGDFRHVDPLIDAFRVVSDQLGRMKGARNGRRKPAATPKPLHLRFAPPRFLRRLVTDTSIVGNEVVNVANLANDRSICTNLNENEVAWSVLGHDSLRSLGSESSVLIAIGNSGFGYKIYEVFL